MTITTDRYEVIADLVNTVKRDNNSFSYFDILAELYDTNLISGSEMDMLMHKLKRLF